MNDTIPPEEIAQHNEQGEWEYFSKKYKNW